MFGGATNTDSRNMFWIYNDELNAWSWQESALTTEFAVVTPGTDAFPGLNFDAMTWMNPEGSLGMYGGEGFGQWGYNYLDHRWTIFLDKVESKRKADKKYPRASYPAHQSGTPGTPLVVDLTGSVMHVATKCKTNKKLQVSCKIKTELLVANLGSERSQNVQVHYLLSNDRILDSSDPLIKQKKTGKIKPGKAKTLRVKLKTTEFSTGKYLIAVIDAEQASPEIDKVNNVVISAPLP